VPEIARIPCWTQIYNFSPGDFERAEESFFSPRARLVLRRGAESVKRKFGEFAAQIGCVARAAIAIRPSGFGGAIFRGQTAAFDSGYRRKAGGTHLRARPMHPILACTQFPKQSEDPMKRLRIVGFVLMFCLVAAGLARAPRTALAAQQVITPTPQDASQSPIRVESGLVNLFVTVRNKDKQIVDDLVQDGQEQKIAFFSKESDLPITLAVLLDTSGSESDMLPAIQDAASRFLRRVLRKGDEALVISFDSNIDLLADFTDDPDVMESAIRRTKINVPTGMGPFSVTQSGGTHFYDALYLASHDKLSDEAGRKAIIAITDANDEGSDLQIPAAVEAAQRTDTVVHVLLVYDPAYGPPGFDVAKKITDETGGRTIPVRGTKNLEDAFDQISEELRSQYTIGYYPTNTKHDGTYRKIKVEVQQKDMDALARKGYYAPQD
jgi:VWFA-related protein